MKYTGKWWDNPNRTEIERKTASFAVNALIWCAGIFLVLVLLLK